MGRERKGRKGGAAVRSEKQLESQDGTELAPDKCGKRGWVGVTGASPTRFRHVLSPTGQGWMSGSRGQAGTEVGGARAGDNGKDPSGARMAELGREGCLGHRE